MSAAVSGGRRVGRKPTLTEADIVAAALAEGFETMSMSSVARRLGVSHSALYRYFPDRRALIHAAVNAAVTEASWPAGSEPWRELLVALAGGMWSLFERHPGMAEAILAEAGTAPAVTALSERVVLALVEQGFGTDDAVLALDFVADLTLTSFVMMAGLDAPTGSGGRTAREQYQQDWRGDGPVARTLADPQMWYGRGWLDRKIELLLDGLATRRHS